MARGVQLGPRLPRPGEGLGGGGEGGCGAHRGLRSACVRVKGATRPLAWGRRCRCRQWPLSQLTAHGDFTQSRWTLGSAGGQSGKCAELRVCAGLARLEAPGTIVSLAFPASGGPTFPSPWSLPRASEPALSRPVTSPHLTPSSSPRPSTNKDPVTTLSRPLNPGSPPHFKVVQL